MVPNAYARGGAAKYFLHQCINKSSLNSNPSKSSLPAIHDAIESHDASKYPTLYYIPRMFTIRIRLIKTWSVEIIPKGHSEGAGKLVAAQQF